MPSQEEARQKIAELVAKYQGLTPAQRRAYNEENTKKDFILPLFAALGWDVYAKDEVDAEEKASKGRVDYAFKLRGVSRFYLEAKPLSADLNEPKWAKQAITYAYNKGVPWAVLTNFAGLQAFNAQRGVSNLAQARFPNLTCQDYLTDFDKLWLLSRESIEAGRLDAAAAKLGVIPSPQPIEKRLFEQLRRWRQELFTQLFHYNPHLAHEQIDETIQRLFNRLIFIRAAEDRGLEEHGLRAMLNQWRGGGPKRELVEELRGLFRQFDGYYDSDLFALHLCDQVFVEAPTIEGIIEGLYDLPGGLASYDFSIIDADVLGQVYEQYLGFVAVEVKRRAEQAQQRLALGLAEPVTYDLEAKQAKRKAEGIYYTPKWVVDYIVAQTVGRFIREHSHDEILNIKVLDPACGSGSFLIRAYDMLLEYHAGVRGKAVADLDWTDRLPILTNNIYGVDLDPQAVEIARLNLLIRALAKRETLPPLKDNIRVGNSLISGDEAELRPYFGDGWEAKRPFNWEREFPAIMARGGFDVVVGNPPYVRVDSLPGDEKNYWKDRFVSAIGKFDVYYLFLELACRLIREKGTFAFITPNRYCTNTTGEKLRRLLLERNSALEITSVSSIPVFADAATYPVITVGKGLDNGGTKRLSMYGANKVEDLANLSALYELNEIDIAQLPRSIYPINVDYVNLNLAIRLLANNPTQAREILEIQEGFRIPSSSESQIRTTLEDCPIIKQFQFTRYSAIDEASYLPSGHFKGLFPTRASRIVNSSKPKLVFAEDALQIEGTLDLSKGLCQGGVYFASLKSGQRYELCYLLGLFNSKILTFIFKALYSGIHMGGGYLRFRTEYLEALPIRRIDFADPADKARHDALVAQVERMLGLHRRLAPLRGLPSTEREDTERAIAQTDRQLDDLVYDLYGLTAAERALVEAETPR